ncbi:MAG TPA: aminotransferase [Bosea sp. (in: a-proteobacteria)]|jgi:aspartate/methionine/tyrosine aminotransferase|uniref:aminotransferase n=1 Tax=Bosea sp. (in: a-proteobacteria) TaxID=1871050 RepID=UPI002DDD5898|nr:aminotransferase [Bosea sp. (in: a-proteobacteria)]HEV2556632.1 aminotransferase [Bosea sp. (in: a-proteobacteria)]
MNPIFSALSTSVFEVMSQLARETGAVNLGQGFPDDPGPLDVRRKAAEAVVDGWNQYPPMMGLPELRQATATHYQHWQGLDLDPGSEIMVTSGATEAIAGALMALVSPGDEVVLFEPMYDAYVPLVRRAGGIPKFVTLRPPHFGLSEEALAAAFSPRTKVVLFNNPLNPTATIFSATDLDLLADFCIRHDAVAICDEVWEHVVFDGRRHVPVLGRPDMRERTVKISSAGKIFSLTGWKVGLVMAAPPLMKVLAKAHQYITFTTPPNLQTAVAYGLGKEDGYFESMRADFQRSRDRFAQGLTGLGFSVLPSVGTYFLNVDIAPLGESDDVAFCRKLVMENGVAAIPVSAFYDQAAVKTVVRFCFAKRDATLDAALERLSDLRRAGTAA